MPAPNTAREFLAAVPAGRGAAARRARALPARRRTGVRRAARGVGLGQGARAPAADLPGRRRGRARAGRAARTSRRSRRRCGRSSPQALAEVAADSGLARDRPDRAGPSAPSRSRSPSAAPATRCAASRRWSTRARPSGSGSSAPRDEAAGAAPARRTPAAAARARAAPVDARSLDGLDNAEQARPRRARRTPSVAELLDDCRGRGRSATSSTRRPPVRDAAAYAALLAPAAATRGGAAARRGAADVLRVLDAWRARPTRLLSGRAELATAAGAAATCAPSSAGWCTAASSARPAPTRLRHYPRYLAALDAPPRAARRRRSPATAQLMDQVADLQEAWLHQVAALPDGPPAGDERCARCAGCSRSTASRCGPSSSAPPTPVSDQRIRKALQPRTAPRVG